MTCTWGSGWVSHCGTPCTTASVWRIEPPTCTYQQAGGEGDWCTNTGTPCAATDWQEVVCAGNQPVKLVAVGVPAIGVQPDP